MSRPRLVHVTTTDISLELLLGPQLRAFAAAGYEVIGASAPGPFVEKLQADGIRHVPLQHATRGWSLSSDARAMAELYRLFRDLQPDIVHTHNPKPGVYGRLAAKAARVPVIVNTQHGLYATEHDRRAKRATVYALERLAATCSDAELIQNEEDLETLARLRVPRHKLTLLGNGIDLDRFDPDHVDTDAVRALRHDLDPDGDAVLIGAVGRLVREKGYPELFDAMEQVRAAHPEARLVVAGPADPDKADGVTQAELDRAEQAGVRFLGMVDDVETLYAALDLYVLASHREGYPRSAMEASAMGLPVVATDIRGCRQVVDNRTTGLLVPARSPDRLAHAIVELIADADRRRTMGASGRRKAGVEFNQQRVIEATLVTYDRLLRAKERPGGEIPLSP
jgi:glycosyltransferase involved in cell wall biosynthesis